MSWILAFAILTQSGAASDWLPRLTLTSAAKLRNQVVKCGVIETGVSVREDRDLQEPMVQIARAIEISDTVLQCVAQASLDSGYYVAFDDQDTERRYAPLYSEREDQRSLEEARDALRRHGLLDRLPRFSGSAADLAAYAGRLEALCGVAPGTLLEPVLAATLTFKSEATRAALTGDRVVTDDQFACVLDAATASNLREFGGGFGFVGNEAFAPPAKPGTHSAGSPAPTAKPPA